VVLWTRDATRASEIAARRENARYLPGVTIPNAVIITDDLERALQADAVVVATPAQGVRELRDHVRPLLRPAHRLCSATKGLTPDDSRRMSELWSDVMPPSRVAVLSGPNISRSTRRTRSRVTTPDKRPSRSTATNEPCSRKTGLAASTVKGASSRT